MALPDEPPYFLPNDSSNDFPETDNPAGQHGRAAAVQKTLMAQVEKQSATHGSVADDYRSVIDDLTIENQKLKERLRTYEASHQAHLDKDKLFEVKVHGLPATKKRELEYVLWDFASRLEQLPHQSGSKAAAAGHSVRATIAKSRLLPHTPLDFRRDSAPNHSSSGSTLASRLVDSAYASMSADASGGKRKSPNQMSRLAEDQKIQSFLHDIPEGFFPKHSPTLTERQKKKLVVRRLEQLFVGKAGAVAGELSQLQQQQEVSKTAAREDQAAHLGPYVDEGVREAHILSPIGFGFDPAKLPDEVEMDMSRSNNPSGSSTSSPPPQRPTRPFDLDPDRAQVPADNVEYIRHLGLSTPRLMTNESEDVDSEADGWVYLNLLTNMAQLHMINVTPDFIRSAVSEVSEKFQLSSDGNRIRWRGGTVGTRLSSDSDASSTRNQSHNGSDDVDELTRKRRKLEAGKFDTRATALGATHGHLKSFQYKPLFRHRNSSSSGANSFDENEVPVDYSRGDMSMPSQPHLWNGNGRSSSASNSRRDNGPIVFYSGARFFTDLSGDRSMTRGPLHVTCVEDQGYSTHTHPVLGSAKARDAFPMNRTPSGSILPLRPFRALAWLTSEDESEVPSPIASDETDIEFKTEWSDDSGPATPLMSFEATGLGGTQPADHFAVRVETRRKKFPSHKSLKHPRTLSKSYSLRKLSHIIAQSSLDLSRNLQVKGGTPPLAYLSINTEVISTKYVELPPSILPPPTAYYDSVSSSDGETSDCSSGSFTGVTHLRYQKPNFGQRSPTSLKEDILSSARDSTFASVSNPQPVVVDKNDQEVDDEEMVSEDLSEGGREDDDESIDMLAQARELDPEAVAARESEFDEMRREREDEGERIKRTVASVSASSGSGSGYSSCDEAESEIYEEIEEDD